MTTRRARRRRLAAYLGVGVGVALGFTAWAIRANDQLAEARRQACTNAKILRAFVASDADLRARLGPARIESSAIGYWTKLSTLVVTPTCGSYDVRLPAVPAALRPMRRP